MWDLLLCFLASFVSPIAAMLGWYFRQRKPHFSKSLFYYSFCLLFSLFFLSPPLRGMMILTFTFVFPFSFLALFEGKASPLPSLTFYLSHKEPPLLESLLSFSKEIDPGFSPSELAREILASISPLLHSSWQKLSPKEKLLRWNRYFFQKLGFSPAKYSSDSLEYLFLPFIWEKKKAQCLGLSAFYLILGRELSLPLFGVSAPGHFFVRYDDGREQWNLELTQQGKFFPDSYYVERYRISQELIDRGVYLTNLENREVIVEFLNNRAHIYYRQGKLDLASRDFDRAIQYSRNFLSAYIGQGFLHLRQGGLEKAYRAFSQALSLNPYEEKALLGVSELYLMIGDWDKARVYLTKLLEVSPHHPIGLTNLGLVFAKRKEWEKALELHKQAISLDPRCLYAYNNLGTTYCRMGRYSEALAQFSYVLSQDPEFFPALHNLITTLERAGEKELAKKKQEELIERYRQKIQQFPMRVRYWRELAKLLHKAGKIQEALSWAEKAYRFQPQVPEHARLLSEIFEDLGQKHQAEQIRRQFKEAIKLPFEIYTREK